MTTTPMRSKVSGAFVALGLLLAQSNAARADFCSVPSSQPTGLDACLDLAASLPRMACNAGDPTLLECASGVASLDPIPIVGTALIGILDAGGLISFSDPASCNQSLHDNLQNLIGNLLTDLINAGGLVKGALEVLPPPLGGDGGLVAQFETGATQDIADQIATAILSDTPVISDIAKCGCAIAGTAVELVEQGVVAANDAAKCGSAFIDGLQSLGDDLGNLIYGHDPGSPGTPPCDITIAPACDTSGGSQLICGVSTDPATLAYWKKIAGTLPPPEYTCQTCDSVLGGTNALTPVNDGTGDYSGGPNSCTCNSGLTALRSTNGDDGLLACFCPAGSTAKWGTNASGNTTIAGCTWPATTHDPTNPGLGISFPTCNPWQTDTGGVCVNICTDPTTVWVSNPSAVTGSYTCVDCGDGVAAGADNQCSIFTGDRQVPPDPSAVSPLVIYVDLGAQPVTAFGDIATRVDPRNLRRTDIVNGKTLTALSQTPGSGYSTHISLPNGNAGSSTKLLPSQGSDCSALGKDYVYDRSRGICIRCGSDGAGAEQRREECARIIGSLPANYKEVPGIVVELPALTAVPGIGTRSPTGVGVGTVPSYSTTTTVPREDSKKATPGPGVVSSDPKYSTSTAVPNQDSQTAKRGPGVVSTDPKYSTSTAVPNQDSQTAKRGPGVVSSNPKYTTTTMVPRQNSLTATPGPGVETSSPKYTTHTMLPRQNSPASTNLTTTVTVPRQVTAPSQMAAPKPVMMAPMMVPAPGAPRPKP